MHHRTTYMYINFPQNRVLVDQSKTCTQIDIQTDFEINRPIRYQITAKGSYFWTDERQTNGQTDEQITITIGIFFRKRIY